MSVLNKDLSIICGISIVVNRFYIAYQSNLAEFRFIFKKVPLLLSIIFSQPHITYIKYVDIIVI
jgi:hypothetical protein